MLSQLGGKDWTSPVAGAHKELQRAKMGSSKTNGIRLTSLEDLCQSCMPCSKVDGFCKEPCKGLNSKCNLKQSVVPYFSSNNSNVPWLWHAWNKISELNTQLVLMPEKNRPANRLVAQSEVPVSSWEAHSKETIFCKPATGGTQSPPRFLKAHFLERICY